MEPKLGEAVSFIDAWRCQRQTGLVVDVRRSAGNPWLVAVVRLDNGSEVEVHPDRLKASGA